MGTYPYKYEDKLETSRLTTRFLTMEDIPLWAEFFRDPEAVQYFPDPGPISAEEQSKQWIERQLSRYADHHFGHQALIDKQTNAFVGQCGLLLQEIDGKTEIEVGYHILKQYRGHGYAPEAARLFIDYAFTNQLTGSVISIIVTGNIRSQGVADKNSLVKEKQTTWIGKDVYIYRISAAKAGI